MRMEFEFPMDIEDKLADVMKKRGVSLEEAAVLLIRRGHRAFSESKNEPFTLRVYNMGPKRENYDKIHDLLEEIEGPDYK